MGLFKRKKQEAVTDLFQSKAIQDEIDSLVRVIGSTPDELEGEEADFRRGLDSYAEASDKAAAEYVPNLKAAGVSPEDAFTIVRSETGDGGLAARVREDLWAARLCDLDDSALLELADEVEQGPPNKKRFLALDVERERRGLPAAPPLDIPIRHREPSWTDEQARFMATNARFWELNERLMRGASPTEIQEHQRVEIEVERAHRAMEGPGGDPNA